MTYALDRQAVRFRSGNTECAAWHYRGANGGCVVMAAGFAVTKEPGTDPIATELARAGFSVLAFDYRHLGESGGRPRQIVRIREQLADWDAAIAFAARLPEVDPARIAIWGFSTSAGHVFRVAARHPELAGAVSHAPNADGVHATRNALRHTPLRATLALDIAALRDIVRGVTGRDPVLVPLTGPRGSVASLTTPDAQNGPRALNPDGRYRWQQEVAARSAVRLAFYRPARAAARVNVPLLVLAYTEDGVAPPAPAVRAARRAPKGELVELPGGHYEAFLNPDDRGISEIVSFLQRHAGVAGAQAPATPTATTN